MVVIFFLKAIFGHDTLRSRYPDSPVNGDPPSVPVILTPRYPDKRLLLSG